MITIIFDMKLHNYIDNEISRKYTSEANLDSVLQLTLSTKLEKAKNQPSHQQNICYGCR